MANRFDPDQVVEYYRQDEFNKIPVDQLIDIIDRIYEYDLQRGVLETWKSHFKSVGRPYAIQRIVDSKSPNGHDKETVRFVIWKADCVS